MHTSVDGRGILFPPARWRGGWRAKRAGWGDFCWLGARLVPPPRPPAEVGCFRLRPDIECRTRVNPSSVGGRVPPSRCVHPLAAQRGGREILRTTMSDQNASRPGLTRTPHAVFEARELLDADRAARMHAPGRDADLGTEAELAAVGKLGRGVVQHDCGID